MLRLRLALVIGSAMVAAAAGPWLYDRLGVPATAITAGSVATALAVAGLFGGREPAPAATG